MKADDETQCKAQGFGKRQPGRREIDAVYIAQLEQEVARLRKLVEDQAALIQTLREQSPPYIKPLL